MSVLGPPAATLTLSVDDTDSDWTRVCIEGELDASNATRLEAALDRLRMRGTRNIELDLSQLLFLDSSGLRAIVTRRRSFVEAGGQLRLVEVPRRLQRVFELSGLGRLLG